MGWWVDSYDERDEYMWTVNNLVPSTAGMWGQPMFTLKYTRCEDPTREGCGCTMYQEEHKDNALDYSRGGVWSEIMRLTDDKMMCDTDVEIHM